MYISLSRGDKQRCAPYTINYSCGNLVVRASDPCVSVPSQTVNSPTEIDDLLYVDDLLYGLSVQLRQVGSMTDVSQLAN